MIKFNTKDFQKSILNLTEYEYGYIEGLQQGSATLATIIGEATIAALYEYIDASAPLNPGKLAHVYEPGMIGHPDGRLFNFSLEQAGNYITIAGKFLESHVASTSEGEPFRERAEIMEAGTSITIAPKNGNVLVFMDDGELVFTSSSVFVEHPGGPDAEQAFGDTVYQFLNTYATKEVIAPIIGRVTSMKAFSDNTAQGMREGRPLGKLTADRVIRGF